MSKISVIINTLNEEKNIKRAIDSVKSLADEIVVVDMRSDDKTSKIAKDLGAKVFEHKRMGYVEPARNFAISKASGDWIFILDADEEIGSTLIKKLKSISKEDSADYVAIPRRNIVFGKWLKHSRWWPDYNVRFFRKGKVTWDEKIHSIPETVGNGIDLEAKKELAIVHHNYETLSQYLRRMDRYTSIQSKELIKGGYKFKWKDLFSKPMAEFLSRYFRGFGYRDGLHGLSLSILQAFSESLVYMKVWEQEGFKKENIPVTKLGVEIRNSQKELNYWLANLLYKNKGGLINRIRRRFKV